MGNRAYNENPFHLHINPVLIAWTDAQRLKAIGTHEELVARGYEITAVNVTMNGTSGIVSCCNDGRDQRGPQFMVTNDPRRRHQQSGPMPEGCAAFMDKTQPLVALGMTL